MIKESKINNTIVQDCHATGLQTEVQGSGLGISANGVATNGLESSVILNHLTTSTTHACKPPLIISLH